MENLFAEFHPDPDIGHLMWRVQRKAEQIRDCQDGSVLPQLEQSLGEDSVKLKLLLDEYTAKLG